MRRATLTSSRRSDENCPILVLTGMGSFPLPFPRLACHWTFSDHSLSRVLRSVHLPAYCKSWKSMETFSAHGQFVLGVLSASPGPPSRNTTYRVDLNLPPRRAPRVIRYNSVGAPEERVMDAALDKPSMPAEEDGRNPPRSRHPGEQGPSLGQPVRPTASGTVRSKSRPCSHQALPGPFFFLDGGSSGSYSRLNLMTLIWSSGSTQARLTSFTL